MTRGTGSRALVAAALVFLLGALLAASSPAAPVPLTPVNVSAPGQSAQEPQVAVDPVGDTVAVWARYFEAHTVIQAASRRAGGAWTSPIELSVAGRNATEPQVALDGAGNATAIWSRYDGADYLVQASARPAGGGWEPPLDLSTTGESAEAPQVAVGPTGEGVAVWSRSDGVDHIVQSAARTPGGLWASPVDLSGSGKDAEEPQVAVDPAGEAVAVWSTSDIGFNTRAQGAVRPQGGSWSPAVVLSAAGMIAENPQVAVDPGGGAVAVWTSSDATPSVIQSATRAPGGPWGAPVRLSEIGRNSKEVQVAFAATGDGVGIWVRDDGARDIAQAVGFDGAGPQLRSLSIPAAATTGKPAAFSVAPFDNWSAIASTRWSFNGEGEVNGTAVTHVYAQPGAYQVTVTTADALGRTSQSSATVTVYPKARAARNIRVKGKLAQLRVQCPSPAGCEGLAKLIAAVKVKRGGSLVKKRLPIGGAQFQVPGSTTATVPIRLSTPALAAVGAAGRRGLKAQLTGPGIKHRVVALFRSRSR